jgi:hypothetical protein
MERKDKSRKKRRQNKEGKKKVTICPNHVGSRFLWNVGELLQNYTTSQPETWAVLLRNQSPQDTTAPYITRVSAHRPWRCVARTRKYDRLVSYRRVGRSKKPVASYGGRTLACLSVCPQVAFGCVNAHNMMVSVAYHNYPIQNSSEFNFRGQSYKKVSLLVWREIPCQRCDSDNVRTTAIADSPQGHVEVESGEMISAIYNNCIQVWLLNVCFKILQLSAQV